MATITKYQSQIQINNLTIINNKQYYKQFEENQQLIPNLYQVIYKKQDQDTLKTEPLKQIMHIKISHNNKINKLNNNNIINK